MKKERNSNMELLRVLAAFMIIAFHIWIHCVNGQLNNGANPFFNYPYFSKRLLILATIAPMGQIGNAIFIIISGYFMVSKGTHLNLIKISKKLLSQQLYASIILIIGSAITFKLANGFSVNIINYNIFNNMAWFVGYYFIVIVIADLFLNKYLASLDEHHYIKFTLVLFSITQLSWARSVVNGFSGGLDVVITGVFLYSLGGLIQKYNVFNHIKSYVFVSVIVLTFLMVYVLNYNAALLGIQNYMNSNGEGSFVQRIFEFQNYDLVPLAIGISLFELFRRMNIPQNKVINFLGSSTFMVYLLHDTPFFYSLWNTQDWVTLLYYHPFLYVVKHSLWAFATFGVGIINYAIYLLLQKLFTKLRLF